MSFDLKKSLEITSNAALILAKITTKKKNEALVEIAKKLKDNKEKIIKANKRDVLASKEKGRNDAFLDRLEITDKIFEQIIDQVEYISTLEDPVGKIIEDKNLENGINLKKVSVPLGVIGIIYEARPNVTIDTAALALKSGNAVILKGGSDSINTNKELVEVIHQALVKCNIPKEAVLFLDTVDRAIVEQLLKENQYVDVIIPRGGYELVKKVSENSTIPVLYHAAGGARYYVDFSANLNMAVDICFNAKTARPAACNALDTVLIHKDIAKRFLPMLVEAFKKKDVEIRGDEDTLKIIKAKKASNKDWSTEFLTYIVAVKVVDNSQEAIDFINKYTKKHSEGIVAEEQKVIEQFTEGIDAAALFVNCSSRFHDGGEFDLGAEMGISTGKMHARGPVGLKELTIYKWIATGNGQIR